MKYFFISIILFFSFTLNAQTVVDHQYQMVFPATTTLQLQEDTVYERFTPDSNDINKADSIAALYISLNRAQYNYTKTGIKNYATYYKQYVGFWVSGKKVILINAACTKSACFNTFLCRAMGGGSCFFDIKINVTEQQVLKFSVNAPK